MSRPDINNTGSVVFNASFDNDARRGIFLYSAGSLTKIIDDTGNVFAVGVGRLNDTNTVAYSYSPVIGFDTIETYQDGTRKTIVTGAEFWPPILGSINNAGTVSFAANIPAGHYGVVTRNGGTTSIVTGATNTSPVVYSLGQMSDSGATAFSSLAAFGVTTLYIGHGGPLTTIASTAIGGGFTTLDSAGPVVNKAGVVAFYSSGYYLNDGTSSRRLFSPAGTVFPAPGTLSLNDNLDVAFAGFYFDFATQTVRAGIFSGGDSFDKRVIMIGDSLFSRTIDDLQLSQQALNDHGQVAFLARFTDGTEAIVVATPSAKSGDFSGDGKSDIFWRHADGTNYIWHVNGAVINGGVLTISSQGLLPGVADPGWSVAGIGDFNGDGKADILWRHTDGTNYVWMLDGSTINGGVLSISSQGLLPGVPGPDWAVAGIGDFNGDGKSDILWRHTDGTNYVWHVDGATIADGVISIASQGLLPGVDSAWSVAGVGDYNGDSKADILWRRNDGTNYVWHVDGSIINGGVLSISSQGLLPGVDTSWSIVGVGDYNGDGKADVLWRRNDGTNYVWHVDGAVISGGVLSIASQGLLPSVTDIYWSVVGAGDYNGDGKADVLWRHANGTNYIWHVDGAVINGGVLSIPSQGILPGVPDPGWQVQNPK